MPSTPFTGIFYFYFPDWRVKVQEENKENKGFSAALLFHPHPCYSELVSVKESFCEVQSSDRVQKVSAKLNAVSNLLTPSPEMKTGLKNFWFQIS